VTGSCGGRRRFNCEGLGPEATAQGEDAAARCAGIGLADGTADSVDATAAERRAAAVDGVAGQVVGPARLRAHARAERERHAHESEQTRSRRVPARLPIGVHTHAWHSGEAD
jgi:hypothetical protein